MGKNRSEARVPMGVGCETELFQVLNLLRG